MAYVQKLDKDTSELFQQRHLIILQLQQIEANYLVDLLQEYTVSRTQLSVEHVRINEGVEARVLIYPETTSLTIIRTNILDALLGVTQPSCNQY